MHDHQTPRQRLALFDRETWWAWPLAFACGVLWVTFVVYGV